MRGGKHSELAKPVFPPRAPPFRARSCCALWKCEYILVGRWILRCWQCNVTPIYTQVESAAPRLDISRQTTGKLSLSSRSSIRTILPDSPSVQPHLPSAWKYQPARRVLAGAALQEGCCFLAGGNLRCFSKVRCLSVSEFGLLENAFSRFSAA